VGVSVVVPAHNASEYIDATLGSIAGQNLQPSEVVVIDDGSDDDTAAVAARWQSVLPLIVLSRRRTGPAAARRAGVDATTAPLIALLDADDLWLPNHLEVLTDVHARFGGVCTANAIRWRPGGGATRPILHARRSPVPPPRAQQVEILKRNFVFIGSLFARSDYQKVVGFRDGVGAEDWDLWIQMIRAGVVVHASDEPTYIYRITSGAVTARSDINDHYVAVLAQAALETTDSAELAIISRSSAHYRARARLASASRAAARGDRRTARRTGVGLLRDRSGVPLRAIAMMLAPQTTGKALRRVTRLRWG
jgi:glycosyltransferase involved in cell wall biosynthesis